MKRLAGSHIRFDSTFLWQRFEQNKFNFRFQLDISLCIITFEKVNFSSSNVPAPSETRSLRNASTTQFKEMDQRVIL